MKKKIDHRSKNLTKFLKKFAFYQNLKERMKQLNYAAKFIDQYNLRKDLKRQKF